MMVTAPTQMKPCPMCGGAGETEAALNHGWLNAQIASENYPDFRPPVCILPETKNSEVPIHGGFTEAADDSIRATLSAKPTGEE